MGVLNESDTEAIKYFELAIEKESHGSMSDAVELYRKAFKINEKVDLLYRTHQVPLKINQIRTRHGDNSIANVNETIVSQINVDNLLRSFEHVEFQAPKPEVVNANTEFVDLSRLTLTSDSISPLTQLPKDVWINIFEILVATDPEAWISLCLTCKKFAFLGFSNDIWRLLCYLVYPRQNYEENQGFTHKISSQDEDLPIPRDQLKILPSYNDSWKSMLSNRPFIKFNGCYISVVNYYSEGGRGEFSSSWANPVRTITYYRYLRFYPDGTCIKVLTALEPQRVIPHLLKFNKTRSILSVFDQVKQHGSANIPTSIHQVKEGYRIYHATWTISTTGQVHVVLNEGSVVYYDFHYHFQVKSLSKVFKHNKLSWIKYYTIRKQIDDNDDDERIGEILELPLGKEKPFRFVKVKSFNDTN